MTRLTDQLLVLCIDIRQKSRLKVPGAGRSYLGVDALRSFHLNNII